jgi:hypothetical protein
MRTGILRVALPLFLSALSFLFARKGKIVRWLDGIRLGDGGQIAHRENRSSQHDFVERRRHSSPSEG